LAENRRQDFRRGRRRVSSTRPSALIFITRSLGPLEVHQRGEDDRLYQMDEERLLERITVNPHIFGGKPIIRGRRLAVEHVLGMLAAGDSPETILKGVPWLEHDDIRACLIYAGRLVGHEGVGPR